MSLTLTIAEHRPEFYSSWSEVFTNVQNVVILHSNAQVLSSVPNLDAEIMMGMIAHERYGGRSKAGESQILSTRGEPEMPPWVVTTAPFAEYSENRQQPDGSTKTVIVRYEDLLLEEHDYICFNKIFERIEQFNQQDQEPKIKTLGFGAEFLNFPRIDFTGRNLPRGDLRKEAEAVRLAYLEHYVEEYMLASSR
jgi:hypothetical protein